MATDVEFPHLSDETDEGVLVTWLVEAGSTVREGDVIATVQVEKVEEDVHAPVTGQVLELVVVQGDIAHQGDVIARIGLPGDEAVEPAVPSAAPTAAVGAPAPGGPVASPAARRVARELGIDLEAVTPSGPGGRIVEDDVRRAGQGAGGPPGEPLPAARRLLADRLRGWLASTAQYTLTSEIDVTDLAATSPPWTAAIVRASALALRDHPRLATRWVGDRLLSADSLDVGVLVALDDGLVVPVVRGADGKDIAALAEEIAALAGRARAGTLRMDDVSGAVFAVTNLGGYPVDAFTPLVSQPATAILGVGRARPRPAVVDGGVGVRTLLTLSLTVDHQVIDGAPAAAFLGAVGSLLEEPEHLTAR